MLANLTLHYGWWLLALVLIGAELMAPGFFMLLPSQLRADRPRCPS